MYSITQGTNYAQLISFIFGVAGVSVDDQSIQGFLLTVAGLIQVVAAVVSFINRLRKGDVNLLGGKK